MPNFILFCKEVTHLIEVLLDQPRIYVIIVALLVTWTITDFGEKLIHILRKNDAVDPDLIVTVLVGLISVGIGGLIATMVRMFESPQVPAATHERLMKQLTKEQDNT